MDYKQQEKELNENDWFNPQASTKPYKIKFLEEISEPKETTYTTPDGTKEIREKCYVKIQVNGEPNCLSWSINKSNGKTSLYGQLITIGALMDNQLTGQTFTLYVDKVGGKRKFTIKELLELREKNANANQVQQNNLTGVKE